MAVKVIQQSIVPFRPQDSFHNSSIPPGCHLPSRRHRSRTMCGPGTPSASCLTSGHAPWRRHNVNDEELLTLQTGLVSFSKATQRKRRLQQQTHLTRPSYEALKMCDPSRDNARLVTPCVCAFSYRRRHCPVLTFHTCRAADSVCQLANFTSQKHASKAQ